MKRSTSSAVTIVAVGLFGFAMNTSLVSGVMARAMPSRSSRWSFSMTTTRIPPEAWTLIGYTTNEGCGTTASSPGRTNAWTSSSISSFEPLPSMMCSGVTPCFFASAWRR